MRVAILHQAVPPDARPDEQDVLVQAAAVGAALRNLRHEVRVITCTLDLAELKATLVAWQPDVVFMPSLHDIHQDHQTIAQEGIRAFKRTTILGYEIPWNNLDFAYQAYVSLERRHIDRKAAALACYASQQHRRYADPEYVWNLARTHGININREYAEVFQVYRAIG